MDSAMSRCERLERWAALLEASGAKLTPFQDVELLSPLEREILQSPTSPLAVAYQDPALRRAGLPSDRFGDGAAFFGLSQRQAHRILCSCGYFGTMRASEVARRIRALAERRRLREWWPKALRPPFARWLAAWRPVAAGLRGCAGR
jgi:hypothetical protein